MTEQQQKKSAPTYVIFDVDILDLAQYQEFMIRVKPALEAAGGKYLARGGEQNVHEGDWQPRRIVLLEFPSNAAWESFYRGNVYQGLKAIRDRCSSARLVSVQGLEVAAVDRGP
jgi:uncharacterized protein (DUF1330 family)